MPTMGKTVVSARDTRVKGAGAAVAAQGLGLAESRHSDGRGRGLIEADQVRANRLT